MSTSSTTSTDSDESRYNETVKWDDLYYSGPYIPSTDALFGPFNIPDLSFNYNSNVVHLVRPVQVFYIMRYEAIDPKWKNAVFNKNFFEDLLQYVFTPTIPGSSNPDIDKKNHGIIRAISKKVNSSDMDYNQLVSDGMNMSKIRVALIEKKNKDSFGTVSSSDAKILKEQKKKLLAERKKKYGIAIVDGMEMPIGNFSVELPGIFIGRGKNTKSGRIKLPIKKENITINSSSIHHKRLRDEGWTHLEDKPMNAYVAKWSDPVTGSTKYVKFSNESEFKSKSDENKFNHALALSLIVDVDGTKARVIDIVRATIDQDANSTTSRGLREVATAIYLIDHLAIRVGSEKAKTDSETMGCSTLNVGAVEFLSDKECKIRLNFAGKDSIQYSNETIVTPVIYKNLKEFAHGKSPQQNLFSITSKHINDTLRSIAQQLQDIINKNFPPSEYNIKLNLTAKVFRTYNSTQTFAKELNARMGVKKVPKTTAEALKHLKDANSIVGELCNHTVVITEDKVKQQIIDDNNKSAEYEAKYQGTLEYFLLLKSGKIDATKIGIKKNVVSGIEKGTIYVTKSDDDKMIKKIRSQRMKAAEVAASSKSSLYEQRDDGNWYRNNPNTSKTNYIDPRTFFFTQRYLNNKGIKLSESTFYSRSLLKKFAWAQKPESFMNAKHYFITRV